MCIRDSIYTNRPKSTMNMNILTTIRIAQVKLGPDSNTVSSSLCVDKKGNVIQNSDSTELYLNSVCLRLCQ